ncbi:chloramphenicol-sensitive protein RarD [Neomicrococcus aestuarii]|uniref:Chloramphenicol-sensitive protein RarD n=1 Tax=Neomicrococcus aestuarii TaxID=556325 RepID=A0A7W8WZH9_9MICC|nr:EamA family transporter RarD [Neomicrococcus aestuarii]MBB5513396.1 chloramphenicol-sensitive protein RarD [Neomicrococcus aestuarii]
MTKTAPTPAPNAQAGGILAGLGAYFLWGLLPLYFALLAPAGPLEIVAARVFFSLVVCLALVLILKEWGTLKTALRTPRTVGMLALASALIAVNWVVYTFAVLNGETVSAALGYFINPLVSTFLGVVILKERLRPLQWVAVGFGLLAVVVLTVGYGSLPLIALTLAFSFGLYGLVKNRLGHSITTTTGLTIETLVLVPFSLAFLAYLAATGQTTITSEGPGHFLLLMGTGIITAVPLLFFGYAAQRLPLSVIGSLQYIAPALQFVTAVVVFHEEMPPERWWGFALVWVAIAILTVDSIRSFSGSRPPKR